MHDSSFGVRDPLILGCSYELHFMKIILCYA